MNPRLTLQLHNTATRKLEPVPHHNGRVTIYTCGPTVYDRATLGNLRTMLFYDWVVRALRWLGYSPERTMNYTDVGHLVSDADEGEDKLAKRAAERRSTAWEVAAENIALFENDSRALNLLPADHQLRATDEISRMIHLVQQLEDKGYTYRTSDGIYFDTGRFPAYGQLAGLDLAGQQAGARVEVNEEKRRPMDFALWKFSLDEATRDMEWDSPWGRGFPGWHLECSAMAMKTLGETIDLHLGGIDLLPVHHENEVAQSEVATGKPFVRHWAHGEHLLVDGQRMGKSLGNFYTLAEVVDRGFSPLDFRYLAAQTHYRSKQNFTWEALMAAKQARQRLARRLSSLPTDEAEGDVPLREKIDQALGRDLDLPATLAAAWEMVGSAVPPSRALLLEIDRKVWGFDLSELTEEQPLPAELRTLVEQREQARSARDWARADELRDKLAAAGVAVEDTVSGSKITYEPRT